MSALAQILKSSGFKITGSDTNEVFITNGVLKKAGLKVFNSFKGSHITNPSLVVRSSAYDENNNVEVREALKKKIPIKTYSEVLAEIFNNKFGIAVAGTHGKTTITALSGILLEKAGLDPTVVVGGIVKEFNNSNARVGKSNYFVLEACEFKKNFLVYQPQVAIIPTIDFDHPDCFRDLKETQKAFTQFLENLKPQGLIIYCLDEENVRHVCQKTKAQLISYGLEEGSDISAFNIKQEEGYSSFEVVAFGQPIGEFKILIPGLHNIKNALAVIGLGFYFKIKPELIREVLSSYHGLKRRFETLGIKRGIRVMDDFAHHPTEIEATLKGIRQFWPKARLWAVFQPYTYSRTKAFLKEFSECFYEADFVVLDEIYGSAREKDTQEVKGEDLYRLLSKKHKKVFFVPGLENIARFLASRLQQGDIVVTLSCGDIYKAGEKLLSLLK